MPKKQKNVKTNISALTKKFKSFYDLSPGNNDKSLFLYEKYIAGELKKFDFNNEAVKFAFVGEFINALNLQKYALCKATKKALDPAIFESDKIKDAIYTKFSVAMHPVVASFGDVKNLFYLSGEPTIKAFKEAANYKFKDDKDTSTYCKSLLATAVFEGNRNLFDLVLNLEEDINFMVDYVDENGKETMPFVQCAMEKGGNGNLVLQLIKMGANTGLPLAENQVLSYLSWQLTKAINGNDSALYSSVVDLVKTVALNLQCHLVYYLNAQNVDEDIVYNFIQHTQPTEPSTYSYTPIPYCGREVPIELAGFNMEVEFEA